MTAVAVALHPRHLVAVQGAGERVLVVDDDPLMRWALTELLTEHGCAVQEAADSGSAYTAFEDTVTRPDIVFLDLHLPDSQDVTTLSSVRVRAPSAKVVLMSAFLTPEIAREARARGAFDVLAKPFDLTTVLALVDRVRHDTPAV